MARSQSPVTTQSAAHGEYLPAELLPCFGCGYDLRGSANDGDCPECGRPFRRDALYRDVVRQKLRHLIDDANFVFFAGVSFGLLMLMLLIARGFIGDDWGIAGTLIAIQGGMIAGAAYLLVVSLYLACWARLGHQILRKRTLCWGQVRGIGLSRALWRGGLSLSAGPAILVFLLV